MSRETWDGIIIGLAVAIVVVAVDANRRWHELRQDNAVLETENRQLYERLAP